MIALVFWSQVLPIPTHMPSLDIIISTFAALCILFVLRAVIESRDTVRAIKLALYGEKEAPEPTGISSTVTHLHKCLGELTANFTAHVLKEEGMWTRFEENIAASNSRNYALYSGIQERLEQLEQSAVERQAAHRVGDKDRKPHK